MGTMPSSYLGVLSSFLNAFDCLDRQLAEAHLVEHGDEGLVLLSEDLGQVDLVLYHTLFQH